MTCKQDPLPARANSGLHRNTNQIRHRLLHRLGFNSGLLATRAGPEVVFKSKRSRSENSSLVQVPQQRRQHSQENYDEQQQQQQHQHQQHCADRCVTYEQPLHEDSSSSNCNNDPPYRTVVRFAPTTTVTLIPSYRDYSPEIQNDIWTNTSDIAKEAQRNRVEYLVDGCDPEKVTEERSMMPWKGELVHPATYWVLYEQEQQQQELQALANAEFDKVVADVVDVDPTMSIMNSSSNSSSTSSHIMSIKRSETASSLVGLAA